MFGAIVSSIASSVVGNIVGNTANNIVNNLFNQFGGSNVQGALQNLVSDAIGSAIKNVINQAPLPQCIKDKANSIVDDVLSQTQQPSSSDCQKSVNDNFSDAINDAAESTARSCGEEADRCSGGGSGKGNWLEVLAGSMAKVQSQFMDKAMQNLEKMNEAAGDVEGGNSQEFLTCQSEYQSQTQMFNIMANCTSTSLKSIGEGLASIARKQ